MNQETQTWTMEIIADDNNDAPIVKVRRNDEVVVDPEESDKDSLYWYLIQTATRNFGAIINRQLELEKKTK